MIEYQNILDKNMLNVLKDILINIRDKGLSNNNHLYVTFSTNHQNVELPNWLRQKYPEEMTIVIQYEYYDLEINKNNFSISLSFNDIKNLKLSYLLDYSDLFKRKINFNSGNIKIIETNVNLNNDLPIIQKYIKNL